MFPDGVPSGSSDVQGARFAASSTPVAGLLAVGGLRAVAPHPGVSSAARPPGVHPLY